MVDDLVGAWLLLLAGRSPDEQYALLRRIGCLSARGTGDRMGVIRLLNREYQAHVDRGNPPVSPTATPASEMSDFLTQASVVPGGREPPAHRLARLQLDLLSKAGYLDTSASRVHPKDVQRWWQDVLPRVAEVQQEHNRIFEAIAQVTPKGGSRTDPITCPLCGRPTPRRATYCVWCGRWLAAPSG